MNLSDQTAPLLAPGEAWSSDVWALLGVTPHPVAPLPDEAWLRANSVGALLEFLNEREETIHRMQADPARYGFEPGSWKVLDALCGFPWEDPSREMILTAKSITEREELQAKQDWALAVRRRLLKRDAPIKILLLNGGNRGGKSEWAASRVNKLLQFKAGARAWAFHQDASMSRDYQQPLIYKYIPAELRTEKGIRLNPAYIAYKQQTGFSEEKLVWPNRSDLSFRYYEQDAAKIEGGELDVVWCDELVPASWIETLKARVATRAGWLLITFTPVGELGTAAGGYSPTVKMFLDRATTTAEGTAYMCPADGGEPDLELTLAGQDLIALAEGRPSQPAPAPGREFRKVPRVMAIDDERSGVFFFHSFDNAYGNAPELVALYKDSPTADKLMRFYGLAEKSISGKFPRFNPAVHAAMAGEQMPRAGTAYMVVDPCSGRNWAMLWCRVLDTPRGKTYYIYRESPCPGRYVPGVGDMGEWAVPGEKHDGAKGPAQTALGWGLNRYLREIYRLEGRTDWEEVVLDDKPFQWDKDDTPEYTPIRKRKRRPEQGEDVYSRILDSRAAAHPTQQREGSTTLLEELDELGMEFVPASGGAYADDTKVHWVHLINDLLDYDEGQPIDSLNCPRLYIAKECKNLIFALQNWTGEDGQKGACKDFIDLVKYLILAETEDYGENAA